MDEVTIGQLNSTLGKEYAQAYRKSALQEMATWAEMAQNALSRGDAGEVADAALYLDFAMLCRQLGKHAA